MKTMNKIITVIIISLMGYIALINAPFLYYLIVWTNKAAWLNRGPYSELPNHVGVETYLSAVAMDMVAFVLFMVLIKSVAKIIMQRRFSVTLDRRRVLKRHS
jgi:hypothetical protein